MQSVWVSRRLERSLGPLHQSGERSLVVDSQIGEHLAVARDVPPYCIAGGNPCRLLRQRFDDELTAFLLALRWWDWPPEKIFAHLEDLCSGDLSRIRAIPLH